VYATYLGGSDYEIVADIAVDAAGSAYVSGLTYSTDFPTVNAFQPATKGLVDVVVAKLSADGSRLIYSTYLGGSDYEFGAGGAAAIAVDLAGAAYIAGATHSFDFPTVNPLQPPFHQSRWCVRGEAFTRRNRSAVFDLPPGHCTRRSY
jgi:hypothetical protein